MIDRSADVANAANVDIIPIRLILPYDGHLIDLFLIGKILNGGSVVFWYYHQVVDHASPLEHVICHSIRDDEHRLSLLNYL